ncbi:hypothetical protein [Streptomyces sp. NPDC056061]|uniref:hypothetical protein n=1 Tax=Streptomyces sp. NPDC056061 TaxID=3345700 RepID=UPI0035D8BEBC
MAVLKSLDGASAPFISYTQLVTVLAAAADAEDRSEAEREHLHVLGAAMFFVRQPDGKFTGSYRGAGPEAWAGTPNQLPPSVHAVWTAYADTTVHPAVSARLHHLLWTIQHGERPAMHLQAAIAHYRNAASLLLADTSPHAPVSRWEAVDALRTARDLAAKFRQPQLTDIITEMLDLVTVMLSYPEPDHGVITAMTEPLLGDKKNHPRLRPLIQRAVDGCRDGSLVQVEFLKDLRRTESDPGAQRQIDERIITALISHAKGQEGLAQLMHLEQAAEFARAHGLSDALDQIRRIQQKIDTQELGLIRVHTQSNLPTAFLDAARAAINATDNLDQALRTIASTLPSFVDPVDFEQHGLIRMPSLRLNLNGPLVTSTSDTDSPAGQDLINARVLSMEFHGLRLEAQLDQVKERFAPTTDQLLVALTDPPIAPASRMRGLVRALDAFWEHDDDTSIALVLPRVEGLLRRRLRQADVAVIQHAQGDRPGQVSQLGSLIKGMEDVGYPEPWPTAFRTLLGGPTEGINLRNDVLHDLTDTPSRHRIALALQAALTVLFLPLPD